MPKAPITKNLKPMPTDSPHKLGPPSRRRRQSETENNITIDEAPLAKRRRKTGDDLPRPRSPPILPPQPPSSSEEDETDDDDIIATPTATPTKKGKGKTTVPPLDASMIIDPPETKAGGSLNAKEVEVEVDLDGEFVTEEQLEALREGEKEIEKEKRREAEKLRRTSQWVEVETPPSQFYECHTQPFGEAAFRTSSLLTSPYQILASAYGRYTNSYKKALIKEAAENTLSGEKITMLIPIAKSTPWVILNLEKKEHRSILLQRKVVANTAEKTFIFFRPLAKQPFPTRVVQILRVPAGPQALLEIERAAKELWAGAKIGIIRRAAKEGQEGSVVLAFVQMANGTAHRFVNRGQLPVRWNGKNMSWEFVRAPVCEMCGGNDHDNFGNNDKDSACPWITAAKKLGFEPNHRIGESRRKLQFVNAEAGPSEPPKKIRRQQAAKEAKDTEEETQPTVSPPDKAKPPADAPSGKPSA
jgi:hypothetical protein